jgi:DNA polymerase-1
LVDGSSFFYRAFHALPPLVNSKGQATGAIYGVASMLKKLMQQYQPDYIAVVFDAPGKTFRQDIYPEYKAHRPPTPVELKSQYQPLVELIQALGLQVFAVPGVEADDVIGSLAKQAEAQDLPCTIVTSDKDFAQLVNQHIRLYNSMSDQWLDRTGVWEKYGIYPEQFKDYLCLIGDTSDNIPGIYKCGPKTATKWLETYGTLEQIIEHATEIPGKIGENLRQGIEFFQISKPLVTIALDLDLPIQISDLKPQAPDEAKLYELAQLLEFKSWLKTPKPTKIKSNIEIIQEPKRLNEWLAQLKPHELLVVDTETSSLDSLQAEIIGVSLCTRPDNACYIPLAHTGQKNCDSSQALSLLKPVLENPEIKKLGQNFKYDMHVFNQHGILVQGFSEDTMLESYVLNSTASRHDLGSLAKYYLNLDSISYEDLAGKGAKQRPFAEVGIEEAAEYSGEDVILTLKLHQHFQTCLSNTEQNILNSIEIPTSIVLTAMEERGVCIDQNILKQQSIVLSERLQALQQEAWALAEQQFNLQSPKQLAEILYQKMQLPIIQKTPSGQASTADEVLQTLALDYPLPAIIIEYRRLSKLLSTYVDGLPKWINPKTHRIHTSYNQAITSTGRLSSTDPNLQNIPVRTEEGRQIRKAFITEQHYQIVTADYSQIELRLMAHFSKDPGLTHAFLHALDVHQATAAEIFGLALEDVSAEQRRHAKTINFGLIYGMSAFGLARQLKISRQDAQNYIHKYFKHYPGVLSYMDAAKQQAHQHGYVETLGGRRLYLPDIHSKNQAKVKAAERIAINAPLQGTAAELIKMAMIKLYDWLKTHPDIRASMLMQVHDELVFEVHEDDLTQFIPVIKRSMEEILTLSIPLIVNIGQGQNWEEAH